MKTHVLKTWPSYYAEVVSGAKKFELRCNDRNFMVGDILVLQEFDTSDHKGYTGRMVLRRVTYLTNVFMLDGYVAMSIEDVQS
jgi:hypothetical protein